ncbi:MAG: SGNH/GDSL hydrolase family protein [Pyrinomonadaceae bacterium]
MARDTRNLTRWQRQFYAGAAVIAPLAPLLLLQGQITRWKVGILPDAAGDRSGFYGVGNDAARLFVIGESTVAGLGARNHEHALAGQFAKELGGHIGRPVAWQVIGKNGVTARRTIDELLPEMPDSDFDYILVGLGGNDVMKLTSPVKWRLDMTELLGILRDKNPEAVIFISNCPMIILSPIMPEPVKSILWKLSRMHDANIREFTANMDRVFYYPQPADVTLEGFFADGIHPSEKGYSDWTAAMMRYFSTQYKW